MATFVQKLQRLASQPLERLPASREEAYRLFSMAVEVGATADSGLVLTPGDVVTLTRVTLELADRLASFDSIHPRMDGQVVDHYSNSLVQIVGALCDIAKQLRFSDAEALRVAAGFKHLLSLGAIQLTVLSEVAASSDNPEQATSANARLVVALTGQLMTANKVVCGLIGFDQRPASTMAAFMRDTAVPSAVVPYIERLSTCVATCLDTSRPGHRANEVKQLLPLARLTGFASTLTGLLLLPAYQAIAAGMAQNSDAQRAVVELLLGVFLPRLDAKLNSCGGAGSSSGGSNDSHSGSAELRGNFAMLEGSSQAGKALLGMLPPLLASETLLPAVTRYLQRQQPWCAALQHAVRCCTALPASLGQGLPLQQMLLPLELHSESFRLVSFVATSGFHSSGSGSGGTQLPAAALLRRLVPHARAVISTVAALQYPMQQLHLYNLCNFMALALPHLQPPRQLGVRDLADWAVAADAGIRLLPLLTSQLLANLPPPPPQLATASLAGVQPAQLLAVQLLHLFLLPTKDLDSLSDQLGGPQPSVLLRLLMQCHASGCRLLHWLAADPARMQLCGYEQPLHSLVPQLMCALHTNLQAICALAGFIEQDDKLRLRVQGVCCAHWHALHTGAATCNATAGSWSGSAPATTTAALVLCCKRCEALARDPEFFPALKRLLASLPQDMSLYYMRTVLQACDRDVLMSARAFTSGLIAMAVEQSPPADADDRSRWSQCLERCNSVLDMLGSTAVEVAQAASGGGNSGSNGRPAGRSQPEQQAERAALSLELPGAASALACAMMNCAGALADAEGDELDLQRDLRSLLPNATRTAQLLERWYQLPEQAEPRRLQLARAAGSRACAFLGCSNLGGGGGPFAGEGESSLRCSGCRAVRYCGTACSHADWRGPTGHRHVCKALAAARAAEKAAGSGHS